MADRHEAPAPLRPVAAAMQAALVGIPMTETGPTLEDFDTKGWKEMKALKDAAPVYTDVASKDKKHHYHPRFKTGEMVKVPQNEQTDRYVQLGYLER